MPQAGFPGFLCWWRCAAGGCGDTTPQHPRPRSPQWCGWCGPHARVPWGALSLLQALVALPRSRLAGQLELSLCGCCSCSLGRLQAGRRGSAGQLLPPHTWLEVTTGPQAGVGTLRGHACCERSWGALASFLSHTCVRVPDEPQLGVSSPPWGTAPLSSIAILTLEPPAVSFPRAALRARGRPPGLV